MDRLQTTAGTPQAGARLDPRRWRALVLLCAANFMVILDSQVVILAVPSISRGLKLSPNSAQWVLSANLITFGGLLLLGGRAADLLGRRRLFMIGTGLFLLISLMSGFAPNGGVLITARALHGVSAALMAPTALSMITTGFPEGSERNKALAGWAGIAGLGATTALLIGGALTDSLGWRWVFFINAPVAAIMLIASPLLLTESRDLAVPRRYDLAGALTSTAALTLTVYAVTFAPTDGWTGTKTLSLFAGAAALAVLFLVIESRSQFPLVPLRIFRSASLIGGNLATVAMGMAAFGLSLTMAEYAQGELHYSSLEFGERGSVMPLLAFIGAFAGSFLITRRGARPVAAACSALLLAGGLLLVWGINGGGHYKDLVIGLFVFGSGLGLGTVAASAAALSRVSRADAGLASGFNAAAFQIGGSFGVAIVTTRIVSRAVGNTQQAAMSNGFKAGLTAVAIFGLASLLLSIILIPSRRRSEAAGPLVMEPMSVVAD